MRIVGRIVYELILAYIAWALAVWIGYHLAPLFIHPFLAEGTGQAGWPLAYSAFYEPESTWEGPGPHSFHYTEFLFDILVFYVLLREGVYVVRTKLYPVLQSYDPRKCMEHYSMYAKYIVLIVFALWLIYQSI